jgi:4-nitrophenyl phosphatase
MKFLINDIRGLIIDMDGVLWHGDEPLPGLVGFFEVLRALHLPFVLATNNASLTAEQYVLKLAKMGVVVSLEEILTSGMATASYLAERYPAKQTRVFVIGSHGATQPLIERGFTLTGLYETGPEQGADLVVSGLDRQLSWDKLATAALNIQAGAAFFGTNGDVTLPTEQGCVPGNGATLAALKAATGVVPIIIGKPEPVLYQQALALLRLPPEQTLAIGDRLDTDILGAVRAGIPSLMVLSGISTLEDIDAVDYAPNWVMQDIQELTLALHDCRESA